MTPQPVRVRLWDPALRAFHWALALSVTAAWTLGQVGLDRMTAHFIAGYVVTGLLVFRVLWGLVGPEPARFSHFVAGPSTVLRYLRHLPERRPSYWPGHNPMGALSVLAVLAVLAVQVVTGMMSESENFIDAGPLAPMVASATRKTAKSIHEVGANLILALVILHVGFILFYRLWKREDLIRPMLTGWKDVLPR